MPPLTFDMIGFERCRFCPGCAVVDGFSPSKAIGGCGFPVGYIDVTTLHVTFAHIDEAEMGAAIRSGAG